MKYNITALEAMKIFYNGDKNGVQAEELVKMEEKFEQPVASIIKEFLQSYGSSSINKGNNYLFNPERIELKFIKGFGDDKPFYQIGAIGVPKPQPFYVAMDDMSRDNPYIYIINPKDPYKYLGDEEAVKNGEQPDMELMRVNVQKTDWTVADYLKYLFCDNLSGVRQGRLMIRLDEIAAATSFYNVDINVIFDEINDIELFGEANIVMQQYQYICYDEDKQHFLIFLYNDKKNISGLLVIAKNEDGSI